MKLLVDTQCWLWLRTSPEKLHTSVLDVAADPATELVFSVASSWEIAIKYALGKLLLPIAPAQYVPERLRSGGFTSLPISLTHALTVAELPHIHRDPFDRLLVAQARCEELTVLTSDEIFAEYNIPVMQAASDFAAGQD
jgi:PIN domain nuclease of toxin-antitoxin system